MERAAVSHRRRLFPRITLLLLAALLGACDSDPGRATDAPITPREGLASPDGTISAEVTLVDGALRYDVLRDGAPLLSDGRLGLITDAADFGSALTWAAPPSQPRRITQDYTLVAGRQSRVAATATERSWFVRAADDGPVMEIRMRVWDAGFAFRYRVEGDGPQEVRSELSTFPVPVPAGGGMQIAQRQTPESPKSQEMYLERGAPGYPPIGTAAPTPAGWAYPMLLRNADADGNPQWLLLSETLGAADWPHTHLAAEVPIVDAGGTPAAVFSVAFPLDTDNGPGRGAPRQEGTWVSPWRWVAVGSDLPAIYRTTAETDLAEPQRIVDTSWIVPGTSVFDYIKETSLTTLPRIRQYMDVAEELGWSYVLVDSDWELMVDDNGIPMILLGDRDLLQRLVDEAAQRGLRLFVWYNQTRFASALTTQRIFSMLSDIGVAGVKIDKWESDKQNSIARRRAILAAAAEHRLMVSFHNVTVPRGLQRTWPNLVGYEGGVSSQVYRGSGASADRVPELHVTQTLLRGILGTFDFGGILFAEPNPESNPRRTTPAHELALMITYQAGLRTMSDDEVGYSGLPEPVRDFLATVPTAWDESRLLEGAIGTHAVVARRAGTDWYIGGINGETRFIAPTSDTSSPNYTPPEGATRTVRLDLAELGCADAATTLYTDTAPPGHDGHAIQASALADAEPTVTMAPFSGFVMVARGCSTP